MSCRTLAFIIALLVAPTVGLAAVVGEPVERSVSAQALLALTDRVEPMPDAERGTSLRDAPLTAPIPASIALFGAALCGLGLVYRGQG